VLQLAQLPRIDFGDTEANRLLSREVFEGKRA
jgi:hypothetical protein